MGMTVSIKLYIQRRAVGQIWSAGHSLPTPSIKIRIFPGSGLYEVHGALETLSFWEKQTNNKKRQDHDRAVRIGDLCHEDQALGSARPCWTTFGYLCAFSLLRGPFIALILQNARG